jgi:hypothetical protein
MDYTVLVYPSGVCDPGNNGRMTESWMIDELAHAGPEHLDPAFVTGYDRKQGYPDPAEDLAVFETHGLGATAEFDRRLYGAYTCIRSRSPGQPGPRPVIRGQP